ncbi:MAG: hypothetical protein AB7O65_09745, partial [Candidatus Korobacteraceae bacterium]
MQNAARALHEAGMLSAYVTTFAYQRESVLGRALRMGLRPFYRDTERQLARRTIAEIPPELVRTHPLPEMVRMSAAKAASSIFADRVWEVTEKWFDRLVARKHLDGTDAVYGYEHAVLETFRVQRARGGICLYEMPIPHFSTTAAILEEEYRRFPDAETERDRHLRRLSPRRNARKQQELELADYVFCNSSFTRDSLVHAGVDEGKIRMIPLGAPPVEQTQARQDGPFIFLSAGTLSVRKGVHYLLEAWRRLAPAENAELWLVGHRALP